MNDQQNPSGGTGLEVNIASLLCYICAPITGIIFLIIEKEQKQVRFHAWQSTLFGVSSILLFLIVFPFLKLLFGFIAGFLVLLVSFIQTLSAIGVFVLWLFSLVKSYQGEEWRIPIIGDMAAHKVRT